MKWLTLGRSSRGEGKTRALCVCVCAKHFLLLVYTTFVNKNKIKKPNCFKTLLRLVVVVLEGAVYPLWRLLETPCPGEPSRSVWGLFNPACLSKLFHWPLPAQFTVPRLTGVLWNRDVQWNRGVLWNLFCSEAFGADCGPSHASPTSGIQGPVWPACFKIRCQT